MEKGERYGVIFWRVFKVHFFPVLFLAGIAASSREAREAAGTMFDSLRINFSYGTYKTGSAASEMDTHGANHGHTFARDDSKLVSP